MKDLPHGMEDEEEMEISTKSQGPRLEVYPLQDRETETCREVHSSEPVRGSVGPNQSSQRSRETPRHMAKQRPQKSAEVISLREQA